MTREQQKEIKSIIDIVSDEYNISLCSPVRTVKEAADVAAFLIAKNGDVPNKAIAMTLGRSTMGEFTSLAIRNVKARIHSDDEFKKKMINLEVKILSSKL